MLATVYRILSLTIGEPVQSFTYAFKNKDGKTVTPQKRYTPREFYNETVGHGLNGTFIMVMNDPRRAYHETYEVEYDRHSYDGHNWKYLNLPMEEIAQLAIASLKDGHKMYSSYDVGKQLDRKRGYMDVDNYDYGSWGAANGQNGCLIMTNQWFNEYMFRLVVNKKYVPAKLLKEYEKTPTMVMPEDPLFGCDE